MRISEIIGIPRGVTAVVGGGGKTTLILRLASELSQEHTTLITTTTHMWPPNCKLLVSPQKAEITEAFQSCNLLAIGSLTPEGKLAPDPERMKELPSLAQYVLVEADGSRGLPLKAPANHEPVLPQNPALVIAVAGMSCVGQTLLTAAHRPERYAEIIHAAMNTPVTPQAVAQVLASPDGQKKNVNGRYLVVLNQTDTVERLAFAREVAACLQEEVLILAMQTRPDWCEHWRGGKQVN